MQGDPLSLIIKKIYLLDQLVLSLNQSNLALSTRFKNTVKQPVCRQRQVNIDDLYFDEI